MSKEERDLYDKFGNKTNRTYYKGEEIPEGYYPMVVMVAIQNSNGDFLMQRRSINKGGDWGVTGGHPKHGESCTQGLITEVKEELGLDISKDSFELFDYGCDGKDCYKMYYLKKDIDINSLKIQKSELEEVKWFSINNLIEMVNNKQLNQNQIDFFLKCKKYLDNKNLN